MLPWTGPLTGTVTGHDPAVCGQPSTLCTLTTSMCSAIRVPMSGQVLRRSGTCPSCPAGVPARRVRRESMPSGHGVTRELGLLPSGSRQTASRTCSGASCGGRARLLGRPGAGRSDHPTRVLGCEAARSGRPGCAGRAMIDGLGRRRLYARSAGDAPVRRCTSARWPRRWRSARAVVAQTARAPAAQGRGLRMSGRLWNEIGWSAR